MENEIVKTGGNGTALAKPSDNPFTDHADAVVTTNIVGKLLKFTKGDWSYGKDNEDVKPGTKFIANMDELLTGWIRWENNKPTDHVMGLVSKGYQVPRRNTLGDTDQDAWEIDNNGKARDPWQLSYYLLMKSVDLGDDEGDDLYTFTASSKGGRDAIALLCKKYGAVYRQKPNEYPIVAIGTDSYKHPNPEFGRIKTPVLDLVGWAPKTVFAGGETAALLEAETKPAKPAKASGTAKAARF
jgi:hypothetical protein